MASCEQCWRDSRGDPNYYRRLIKQRKCTPEEQAGSPGATKCEKCGRRTVHIYCHVCMNPGCEKYQVDVTS